MTVRSVICLLGLAIGVFASCKSLPADEWGSESPPPPCKLSRTDADYFPDAARALGLQGRVLVEFGLTEHGTPTGLRILAQEPQGIYFGREALALTMMFHCCMRKEWSGPGASTLRFRMSYVFRLVPCRDPCRPVVPYRALSETVFITAEAPQRRQ